MDDERLAVVAAASGLLGLVVTFLYTMDLTQLSDWAILFGVLMWGGMLTGLWLTTTRAAARGPTPTLRCAAWMLVVWWVAFLTPWAIAFLRRP